jgi:hypothetical protein
MEASSGELMSDRPSYLIIVTHQGNESLDVFSAHHAEADAKTMYNRLRSLLAPTQSIVHMVEVPEVEGVARAPEPAPPPVLTATPVPAPVRRPLTQEEFEEETRRMLESDESVIISDTPDIDDYRGAYS